MIRGPVAEESFIAKKTGQIEIHELRTGEEGEWNRFVLSSPSGTFFHLLEWRSVLQRVLGHQCFYLVACREGRVSGVFPIGWVRNRLFGDCMVSLPLTVYGGICADDSESYYGL